MQITPIDQIGWQITKDFALNDWGMTRRFVRVDRSVHGPRAALTRHQMLLDDDKKLELLGKFSVRGLQSCCRGGELWQRRKNEMKKWKVIHLY